MSLIERINADTTSAMKNKNGLELSTLRLVRSSLKNRQIDLGKELNDEDATIVLKSLKKQFTDALQDFEKAGREDLITRQKAELSIIERYLPESLPPDELEHIVAEAIREAGYSSPTDIGKAIGAAMKAVAGRAEGNDVRTIVQRLLSPS